MIYMARPRVGEAFSKSDLESLIERFAVWYDQAGEPVNAPTYNAAAYFVDGVYLGPDEYGVEPHFYVKTRPDNA